MNEELRQDGLVVAPQADADMAALIKKVQQQLVFLEKKIDTLISQSQQRPFQQRHFSKPYRPFDHPHRHGKEEHRDGSGERDFGQGRPFKKHRGGEHQGFGRKKKPFFFKGKNRDHREHR